MLLAFLNSNNDLTTGGIIAIVFFVVIVLAIIFLTIGFFIYKGHVKSIYSVERRLTKLLNNPIENKIKRLSNVAETNDDFIDQVDDVKVIYTNEIVRRLNSLSGSYQEGTQTKKIWKINKLSRQAIKSWVIALDKIDAEINVLSTVIDISINTELELRDDLVDFMKEWNNIEMHFEDQKDNSEDKTNFINQSTIDKFNKQKNIYLANYDKAISNGDFASVKNVYNKLNDLGKQLLKETNLYSTHMDYFIKEYPDQKNELIDKNSTNESIRKLKKQLDEDELKVNEAIANEDYSKVIDEVNDMFTLLSTYKHNRKLENAFELFIETSGDDLENFFNDLEKSLEVIKNENSDQYVESKEQLEKNLREPINNIKKIVNKLKKETSKAKANSETLNDQRIDFEDNLRIANRGIELLKSIKTEDEKSEEEYIAFLSEMLKAKSTLISIKNLLSNKNNGLSDDDIDLMNKQIDAYQKQLDELDVNNAEWFENKYDSQASKAAIIKTIEGINTRLDSIYNNAKDAYRYYNLALAIKIMYTDIKQPEVAPLWDKLMELFYKKQYKEFVQGYIRESENNN